MGWRDAISGGLSGASTERRLFRPQNITANLAMAIESRGKPTFREEVRDEIAKVECCSHSLRNRSLGNACRGHFRGPITGPCSVEAVALAFGWPAARRARARGGRRRRQ